MRLSGRRRLVFWAVLCLTFFLGACRDRKTPPTAVEASADKTPQTTVVVAESTVDSLRVRSQPYLDSTERGRLMQGDTVTVESRTQWTQTIDSRESAWFFCRAEGFSGWVFGGYLDFPDTADRQLVAVDPSLDSPKPIVAKTPDDSDGRLDPADLPELRIPTMGMEALPDSTGARDTVIGYDPLYNNLLLWFEDNPDSRLNQVVREAPESYLRLVAKSPGGREFEVRHRVQDLERYSDAYGVINKESLNALLVPFRPYGPIPQGAWEFYLFGEGDNWPLASGVTTISPPAASLVSSAEPQPFIHRANDSFSHGSKAYAFGWDGQLSPKLQVALYYDTRERDEKMNILVIPVAVNQVFPDKKGFWSTEFRLEKNFPKGRYWVAVGKTIENSRQLSVFKTSLQLE